MRAAWGYGGWVGIDDLGLPGLLYVRVAKSPDGRLRIGELYLDASASEAGVRQQDLRALPLAGIEAFLNEDENAAEILINIDEPGPDLSTLASYFRTRIVNMPEDAGEATWVAQSLVAQLDSRWRPGYVRRVRRQSWAFKAPAVTQDREFRLSRNAAEGGLTDDFLRDVSRAYAAAVMRGERPNKSLGTQTGHVPATAAKWVYTARRRGIMPPASKKGGTG
jgi:hypothetical protein